MAEDQDTNPTPPPTDYNTEPQWAIDLRKTIEGLPGKLRAVVSDEDKTSIAETVHGLFEKSGAFEAEQQSQQDRQEQEPETEQKTESEAQPKKHGWASGFASWFAGES